MARKSSSRSGNRKNKTSAADSVAAEAAEAMGNDTVVTGDPTATDEVVPDAENSAAETPDAGASDTEAETPETESTPADSPDTSTVQDGETSADPAAEDMSSEATSSEDTAPQDTPQPDTAPQAAAAPAKGAGVGTLLAGGVVAAALGYGAAFFGMQSDTVDTASFDRALSEASAAISAQQDTITALEAQVAALSTAEPQALPEMDLSGVEGAVAAVAGDVDGITTTIEGLTGRIVALEERPVFSGDVAEDSAAMAETVANLEARLSEERDAAAQATAAAEQAAAQAAAQVEAASAEAAAAMEQAAEQAQATADAALTRSALAQVQAAMASGAPFTDALADLPAEAPAALAAVAEAGAPTLEGLQAAFPGLARAALPIALRETAGDRPADRVGAFLMAQLGGRSVEPRDGDDPDAVLSRAEAAVASGDLPTALAEISALTDGAQAVLQDWVGLVEARAAADTALAELTATLEN